MKTSLRENYGLRRFDDLEQRLGWIKNRLQPWCHQHEIIIAEDHDDWIEWLAINLNWEKEGYGGNICILLDEERVSQQLFRLGAIKTHDVGNRRYYKRQDIIDNVDLSKIERRLIEYVDEAYSRWSSWSDDDLTEFVELTSPPPRRTQ
jgi:hypothetical protein